MLFLKTSNMLTIICEEMFVFVFKFTKIMISNIEIFWYFIKYNIDIVLVEINLKNGIQNLYTYHKRYTPDKIAELKCINWYSYYNTVSLSTLIFCLVYNLKFSTISSCYQPALKSGRASAMAPVYLHNKGNHHQRIYNTVVVKKVHPLHHGLSFNPSVLPFLL